MKKKFTGKEDFSQQLPSFNAGSSFTLSNKAINYIRSYVYNNKDYPYFLRITSKENLLFILNFIKLKKDISNILKELKKLKEEYSLKLDLVDKNIYYMTLKKLRDYRYIYNSLLYKYNYIIREL